MLAEIITIGDEILIGQIVDTNSAWMAKELNKIGMGVKQITSVSDNASHIVDALNEAQNRADVILITGGLGPTKDDITKLTLAKYFNMPLRQDKVTLDHITAIFARLNRPMIEANIRQADVPDGCKVIQNANGTAPCMWFEHHGKIIVSMPGVPFEMMYLMEEEIIPRLKAAFNLPFIFHQTILTAGLGESFLAQELTEIEDKIPAHIKLAYLPKLGQVRLRLSGTGDDENRLKREIAGIADEILTKIEPYVVVADDIALEKAILDKMKASKLTLSTAESCTGGYISHLITQHAGSSAVFAGGAVVYSYDLKESVLGVKHETLTTFGAVSEQTVTEMAEGAIVHFKTDYAIAVSGIAGPDGGLPDKPVGTVWIAIASKERVIAKLFTFGSKRIQNIERSATAAFTLLLKLLKEDNT
ncbi:competence/damage-inducible protein A [Pedobacter sp. Du54]|uniref:competence/damage-inducible protein A n=1 Tax=Pedobacter anseongensis TaxID=3133439 RepID=UPI0030AE5176